MKVVMHLYFNERIISPSKVATHGNVCVNWFRQWDSNSLLQNAFVLLFFVFFFFFVRV